jgi:NAD(P)-dependent dehydrogenase (short-subunit alcohol dehydrogenase family)
VNPSRSAGAERLFDLTGKVALVTGAGMGLGRIFSAALARFGAEVICADRDAAGAGETAAAIVAQGGRSRPLAVDVSDPASVDALMHGLGAGCALDILVNNAGIATPPYRVHELPVADWNRVIATNLSGTFLVTRAVLPLMLAGGGGSIVNVSSVLGSDGYHPGFPVTAAGYGASKAGIVGFTRQVAMEYARDNIRVNAIAPGWHAGTQLGRERRATATPDDIAQFEAAILRDTPMGRRGGPDELEGLMIYLASDASRFVTGGVFAHDGGWNAR